MMAETEGRVDTVTSAFQEAAATSGLEFVSGERALALVSQWALSGVGSETVSVAQVQKVVLPFWELSLPDKGEHFYLQQGLRFWVLRNPGDPGRLLLVARGRRNTYPISVGQGENLADLTLQIPLNMVWQALFGRLRHNHGHGDSGIEVLLVCLYVRGYASAPRSSEAWRSAVEGAEFHAIPFVGGIKLHDTRDRPSNELLAERTAPERLVQLWRLGQLVPVSGGPHVWPDPAAPVKIASQWKASVLILGILLLVIVVSLVVGLYLQHRADVIGGPSSQWLPKWRPQL